MGDSTEDREEHTLPGGGRVVRQGNVTRLLGPPSEAQAAENLRKREEELGQAEVRLPQLVARLRQLVESNDPLDLIGPLTVVSLTRPIGAELAMEHYGRQARVEYLAGMALSCESRASATPSARVLGEAGELVNEIFALEEALHFDAPDSGFSDELAFARYRLRLEHLLDRSQGYLSHREMMARAVFKPMEERCREEIGFSPAALPEIVVACHRLAQHRIGETQKRVLREEEVAPSPMHDQGFVTVRPEPFRGVFEYSSQQIADEAGLDAAEVHAALLALSSRFGELPADLRPRDENRVRRFPVIPVGEDLFFFPFLWSPLDEFVPWFLGFVRAQGKEKLEKRFLRARDDAAEKLTRDALAKIFGSDLVLGPLHYEVDGADAELDCLVDAWPLCLVAEVKAHRVTDSAWRGSPDRVRRLDADLGKARTQASRVARFLREGGLVFRKPGSSDPVQLARSPDEIFRLAVSFEGVDPLTFPGGLGVDPSDRIWNVSLGDLLMATEILDDPGAFAAYLEARTHLVGVGNFLSFMEVDLVGGFLEQRLIRERAMAKEHPDAYLVLGYHGSSINRYFANRDFGFAIKKPTCEIPAEVVDGVRWMMRARHPEWHRVALAVMAASPEAWRGWKKQLRRARRGGRSARKTGSFNFYLPGGPEVAFFAAKGNDCFDLIDETAASRPGALVIVERQGSPRQLRAASAPAVDSQSGSS